MDPVIVIPAYNRPYSLYRLLKSISRAQYNGNVKLIISIDGIGNEDVVSCANNFSWAFGEKEVIIREQHLGLKKHILACTDLVDIYENIIVLEDDLFVSPYFYEYAQKALRFFGNDEKLAGISLYSYSVSEFSNKQFTPLDDGYDNYFLQLPSSWGQVFTRSQWTRFREWFSHHEMSFDPEIVPAPVTDWGEHSWKKHFIHYLIQTDRYFIYPKLSLTTNFEDIGTNSDSSGKFQVAFQESACNYHFSSFSRSNLKYDSWYEILPEALNTLTPVLSNYDFEVDLNGTKNKFKTPFVLTSKPASSFELSFSGSLKPDIQNIIHEIPGKALRLVLKEHIDMSIYPEGSQRIFFVVVPVVSVNIELLRKTIKSFVLNSYPGLRVAFSVNDQYRNQFINFINTEFSKEKVNWVFYFFETSDVGLCLKNVLDLHSKNTITWLFPGSELTTKDLVIANKIFSEISQAGAIIPAGITGCSDEFRLNREVILQSLSEGEMKMNTELIFFRGDFWPYISKKISHEFLKDGYFISWFLFGLLMETDLYPCVSELGSGRAYQPEKLPSIDRELLLNKEDTRWVISKKAKRSLVFKLLKLASKSKIPVVRELYYLYYDLPLIIYSKDLKNGSYLLNK